MHVSLGGGHNVANLARVLAAQPELDLKFGTPSELTAQTGAELGLTLQPLSQLDHIDVAFDGCDSINPDLVALKSNGGIHVFEKLYAINADRYVILAPASRLTPFLNPAVPLAVEVLPLVAPTLERQIVQRGYQVTRRTGERVASFARTPNGNFLLDCHADSWHDVHEFNAWLQSQSGVVATSLFENVVTGLLTFDENNQIQAYGKDF
ncbi:ribose-5-phosphate isomerase A [Lactiplantibacillus pentosus]|uniref:ribose-5-phosphate isomerase A n=1 Tax=Lactiplantibacillus pentosus TaxID=1589 RepID=UPI001FD6694F|nr:ribose-5-phosphate isomerase A [Lactiplantibacillus pentosus]MCJ8189212.1 ribose-5-phosphate isomerase A [Lactiplantibacillus pentosus]